MRALAITGIETAWMIPSIMSGSLIRAMPPWARMSAGTRSSAMTATAPASSAILACSGVTTSMMTPPLSCSAMPRLTASLPVTVLAGRVLSAPVAAEVWGCSVLGAATGCCLGMSTTESGPRGPRSIVRRSGARPTGPPCAAGHTAEAVVDVEVPRQGAAGVQPEQPGQPAPAQLPGVADGVVVEPPGQHHSRRGAGQVRAQRRRDARQVLGQVPQLATEQVLGGLAVAVPRRAGVPGEGDEVGRPALPHRAGALARQLLARPAPPLQLRVQRRPRPGDADPQPPEPGELPERPPQQEDDDDRAGQREPGLGGHGASG